MKMPNNTRVMLSKFAEIATDAVKSFDENRRKETSEKILIGLKKMGVATQDELSALKEKTEALEAELRTIRNEMASASKGRSKSSRTETGPKETSL